MSGDNRSTLIALTLLLGIVLQVVLVFADSVDSPRKAAVEFAKAYYALDPAMAQRLCAATAGDKEDGAVAAYIWHQQQMAEKRGFEPQFMPFKLMHPEIEVLSRSDSEAQVLLSASRRRDINPVFTWVAQIFHLGNVYPVKEELSLIKEEGRWKVCGAPFDLGDFSS
ncbi:MAG: hypothetical protein WBG37_21910 [Desulfobacterales bacterium]|jgi:hypothetical protein